MKHVIDRLSYFSYGAQSMFVLFENDNVNEVAAPRWRAGCREYLAGAINSSTPVIGYFDNYNKLNKEVAIEGWRKIEEILGLKPCLIEDTDNPYLLIFHIDEFWRENIFRRAMFSLLLRLACVYYKKGLTLSQAAESYSLALYIWPTVVHFLAGNTTFTMDPSTISSASVVQWLQANSANLDKNLVKFYRNEKYKEEEKA